MTLKGLVRIGCFERSSLLFSSQEKSELFCTNSLFSALLTDKIFEKDMKSCTVIPVDKHRSEIKIVMFGLLPQNISTVWLRTTYIEVLFGNNSPKVSVMFNIKNSENQYSRKPSIGWYEHHHCIIKYH